MPNSTPTLLSVSHFDEADCYTLFGDRWCVTFENQDSGKLLRDALTKGKVILTGTKGTDRLYHLNTPCQSKEFFYLTTQSPMSKLEQLHYLLGHLNYQAIKAMVCKGTIKGVKLLKKEFLCVHHVPRAKPLEHVLGLVYCDLWGLAPVQTVNGT